MRVEKMNSSQFTSTNFNGKTNIIPGDLSYEPAKYLGKAYKSIENMIKDKNFDLFIKQNHQQNTVSIIARQGKKRMFLEAVIPKDADIYEDTAKEVIQSYEDLQKSKPTFKDKVKKFLDNAGEKFLKTMEIKE